MTINQLYSISFSHTDFQPTMTAIRDAFFPTPYSEYMFLGVYIVLCFTYMIFGINFTTGLSKMLLKSSPVLFLISYFFYTILSNPAGPGESVDGIDNLERLIFGLIFSCLGDCYLVFDSFFIHGLLSFACAQLIYISMFNGHLLLFIIPAQSELVTAAAVGLVSLLVFFSILPRLSYALVIPAAMYCLLISVMLWCAVVTMQQDTKLPTLQSAIGACLFYMSDLLLSLNRWRLQIPHGHYLIIATYYAAQILIFFSVINNF